MSLTKTTQPTSIEVKPREDWFLIQLETSTIVYDNNVEISRAKFRKVIAPTDVIDEEHATVQAVCNAVNTQVQKDAYAAHLSAQAAE
jgi:hypothetical protein